MTTIFRFSFQKLSDTELVDKFYTIMSRPLSTGCRKLRNLGGRWLKSCAQWDGKKFFCQDDFNNTDGGECLVYSFGIRDDIAFERGIIDTFGCRVEAYDPTISPTVQFNLTNYGTYRSIVPSLTQ